MIAQNFTISLPNNLIKICFIFIKKKRLVFGPKGKKVRSCYPLTGKVSIFMLKISKVVI